MERRARPLWQYPSGNYHSPIVNVPIPQVASPAIRIANSTGVAGPSETRPGRKGENERSECDNVAELLVGKSRK